MDTEKQQEKVKKYELSAAEKWKEYRKEAGLVPEKKEKSQEEKEIQEKLMREIDLMDQDENLKNEAAQKAKKIQVLGEAEKIEHLMAIARKKGVVVAIQLAKAMNDPYLLDIFHDILAQEGYYQKFLK